MLRYLSVWRRFVIMAFVREAEYRFNFFIKLGEGAIQLVLAVLSFALIYRFTDQVNGWTSAQALMLVGVYRAMDGLINLQITPNMWSLGELVRQGDLDFVLLRPVSSQFYVSAQKLELAELANALAGVALTFYAGQRAGVDWSIATVAAALTFALCGLLIVYALRFAVVTLSFWLIQIDTLDTLFYSFFETARYPISFFNQPVRLVLTFVLPVAFVTTFPTQALLGTAQLYILPIGLALALGTLAAATFFWNYAIRHYSSASS